MSRALPGRPSSLLSSASGSRARPSSLRCTWRSLRWASWRSRSARRVASLSEMYFFAASLRQQRCEVAVLGVRHGGDAGPRQCVVVGAFAELGGIDAGREGQGRHHALVLGAAAADAEELGDGQLDLAEALGFAARPAIEVDDVLHGALAEAGFTDHQATTVVLDGAGEDFRGRGQAAVAQHRQRAIPRHALVAVAVDGDAATGLTHLHHRALLDEQAGQSSTTPYSLSFLKPASSLATSRVAEA
ncbi:hypothetical protein G6F59_013810 [Rhizopus arrhizus]|nr:hypothetical protein G6F59_013810 [Rhizopus arrhizus]